jgi:hypothetical protein
MLKLGVTATSADLCLFYRNEKDRHARMYMLFHVDDAQIAGCDLHMVEKVKSEVGSIFSITDLGDAQYFLGIKIAKTSAALCISQAAYWQALLQKHNICHASAWLTPSAKPRLLQRANRSRKPDSYYLMTITQHIVHWWAVCSTYLSTLAQTLRTVWATSPAT